jgi:large subunit ribosomal protein L4
MASTTASMPLLPYQPPAVYVTLSHLVPPPPNAVEQVVQLNHTVFAEPIRRDILHACVVQHRDGLRQGSANTKTRAEVRGSGRKIRPQKGSGRARLGDGQSPMLRGGGISFGPKPRDFSTKLPRKVRELGMRVALSARLKNQTLGVIKSVSWPVPKTNTLERRLHELQWKKTLFVTGARKLHEGFRRASSNLKLVTVVNVSDLDIYSLVRWPRVVLDVQAVDWLEHNYGKKGEGMARIAKELGPELISSDSLIIPSLHEPAAATNAASEYSFDFLDQPAA